MGARRRASCVSIEDDGTLLLMEKDGAVKMWLKGAAANSLARYVDALVQVRGVYSKHIQSHPMMLVPSLDYIQVKESPPENPFVIPSFSINQVAAQEVNPQTLHRLKVTGVVTYRDDNLLFVQDDTGSASILTIATNSGGSRAIAWKSLAFPKNAPARSRSRKRRCARPARHKRPSPPALSLADVTEERFNGSVVRLEAIVLEQKTRDGQQSLELQIGPARVPGDARNQRGAIEFDFRSAAGTESRASIACNLPITSTPRPASRTTRCRRTLDVLLRSPADVVLIAAAAVVELEIFRRPGRGVRGGLCAFRSSGFARCAAAWRSARGN